MSISVVYNVDKMLLVITYSDQCTSTEVTSTVYRPIHVTQDHSDLLQAHQTIRSLSQQNDIVGIKEDAVVSIVEMNHLSQRTYICLTVVSNSLFPATSSKCRSQFSRDPLLWIMYRILLGSCRGMEALCQKSWLNCRVLRQRNLARYSLLPCTHYHFQSSDSCAKCHYTVSIFSCDAMQARPMPSCGVCPSVCLSVCRVRGFCRNGWTSSIFFSSSDSHTVLVCLYHTS